MQQKVFARLYCKDDRTAAVVEVNSETDFVAKNEVFQSFVAAVANQAVDSSAADMDAFMAEKWNQDNSITVKEASSCDRSPRSVRTSTSEDLRRLLLTTDVLFPIHMAADASALS